MSPAKTLYHFYMLVEDRDKLIRLSHRKSLEENRRVTISGLISEALQKTYFDKEPNILIDDIPTKGRKWTSGEVSSLVDAVNRGHSYKEIAKALGRTEDGCRNKFKKIKAWVDAQNR